MQAPTMQAPTMPAPTMPQSTRHSLIPFLLSWITLLSVVQVAVIVVFFTVGHHGSSSGYNGSRVTPETPMKLETNNKPSSPSEHGLLLGKGKMLTFMGSDVNSQIKWSAKRRDPSLVSEEENGRVLKIRRDGYFFLNFQVTLMSCKGEQMVLMKRKDERERRVIMQGWINEKTCSTGLVGKVEELYAGCSLEVTTTSNHTSHINETLTHLDIIYMMRP